MHSSANHLKKNCSPIGKYDFEDVISYLPDDFLSFMRTVWYKDRSYRYGDIHYIIGLVVRTWYVTNVYYPCYVSHTVWIAIEKSYVRSHSWNPYVKYWLSCTTSKFRSIFSPGDVINQDINLKFCRFLKLSIIHIHCKFHRVSFICYRYIENLPFYCLLLTFF